MVMDQGCCWQWRAEEQVCGRQTGEEGAKNDQKCSNQMQQPCTDYSMVHICTNTC